MDEKEIKEHSERYVELLGDYTVLLGALDKILKKITAARKEIMFLEEKLQKNDVTIKDTDNAGDNTSR